MNTKLESLLQKAQYYTPSKTVELAAGAEKTIQFTGLNGKHYGVNRLIPGATDQALTDVTATIAFNNGRDKRFEDVQLEALRQLFLSRSLRGGIVIEQGTQVFVTLKNTGSSTHFVNFQLLGYDAAHLQQKQESYRCRDTKFPEPEFIYVNETIPAGAGQQRLSVLLPAYKLRLYRMAASSAGEDDIRLSIRQDKTRIKPEIYLQQINDEFRDMDIILPITLQADTPFDLFVTNTDGSSAHDVSFIAECYRI